MKFFPKSTITDFKTVYLTKKTVSSFQQNSILRFGRLKRRLDEKKGGGVGIQKKKDGCKLQGGEERMQEEIGKGGW